MAAQLSSITGFEVDHLTTDCFSVDATKTGFTVPADCDCLAIVLSGYCGAGAVVIAENIDPPHWDEAGTPTAMSIASRHSDGSGDVVEIWYLLSPAIGNLDLHIHFSEQLAASGSCTAVYLKDVDPDGTIVTTATDNTSASLVLDATGGADDFAIGSAYGFNGSGLAVSVGTELHTTGIIGSAPCDTAAEYNSVGYDDTGTNFSVDFTGASASFSVASMAVFKGVPSSLHEQVADIEVTILVQGSQPGPDAITIPQTGDINVSLGVNSWQTGHDVQTGGINVIMGVNGTQSGTEEEATVSAYKLQDIIFAGPRRF